MNGVRQLSLRASSSGPIGAPAGPSTPRGNPLPDEARVHTLIAGGVLSPISRARLWSGRCRARHRCTICAVSINVGEVEFRITPPAGVVIFMHLRCLDLWAAQGVRKGQPWGTTRRSPWS